MKNTGSNKKVLGKTAYSLKLVTPIVLTVIALVIVIAFLGVKVRVPSGVRGMCLLFAAVCAVVSLPFWFLPLNAVVYDESKQILILRGCGQNFTSLFRKVEIDFLNTTCATYVPHSGRVYGGLGWQSKAGLHILAGARSLACLQFVQSPEAVAEKINEVRTNERIKSIGIEPQETEEPVRFTDEKIEAMYSEVGVVTYVDAGIKFKAGGKFAVEKDFNGKKGYHLAFTIVSEGLHYMPEDYDDVCDYGGAGFTIDIGYFEDYPFTEENENGVIVKDLKDIEGTVLDLEEGGGYTFGINTVEYDDFDKGELKIVKWAEDKCLIQIKLLAAYGLADVVVGTVELQKDDRR